MHFFNQIGPLLKRQNVESFPEAGIAFLQKPTHITDEPLGALHRALTAFIFKLIPRQSDIDARQMIVNKLCDRISKIVSPIIKQSIILPCGSCMSGTFLSESDIDLALFALPGPCNPIQIMDVLIDKLSDIAIENSFYPIPQARVPVLKFIVKPGIPIDLSIDELHGPLNVAPVRKAFASNPCILPAQVFLKCVLKKSELDQPYTGGISSYTLQLMLIAYIQYKGEPDNVTELIDGFCNFYGNEFNFILTGIDIKGKGSFFSRLDTDTVSYESPTTMFIRDPLNPKNILGHNAFKMNQIRILFRDIHEKIRNGAGIQFINSLSVELNEIERMRDYADEFMVLNEAPSPEKSESNNVQNK